MRDFRSDPTTTGSRMRRRSWLALALLAALAPGTAAAQVRDVISKEIAVGQAEASLALELDGGAEVEIAFRDGVVWVDGEEAGRFEPGSELESAWRGLLGTAVALDDGPLARALVDWEAPSDLEGSDRTLGRDIDEALESALERAEERIAPQADAGSPDADRLVRSLLARTDRLRELGEAMEGLRLDDVMVHVGEDVLVGRETRLDATLVAVDSDVEVRGEVRGDVVVVDGTLRVVEGGRISGDVRLADARLVDRDGEIEGSVVEVTAPVAGRGDEVRDQIRDELRRELRDEIRSATRERAERDDGWGFLRPFRAIGSGIAGVLGVLLNTAVVALLGWGVVFFVPDNLSVVADTARRAPGRSVMVGLAGAFLLLPVWILGGLALILTVVGIFALPFWIALFPLAVVAAAGLGFYAVASGIGEHLARRRYPFLDWVRSSNAYTLVTGGLIALAAPFLLANVMEMAVLLGFLEGLLTFVGWLAVVTVVCMGFGAVLITRGGRRPDFYGGDPFDDDTDWPDGLDTPGPRGGGPSAGDDWFGTGAPETAARPSRSTAEPGATAAAGDAPREDTPGATGGAETTPGDPSAPGRATTGEGSGEDALDDEEERRREEP